MVKVAFDRGDGWIEMAADSLSGEAGPGGVVTVVDGFAPSGGDGISGSGVVEFDLVGNGFVGECRCGDERAWAL